MIALSLCCLVSQAYSSLPGVASESREEWWEEAALWSLVPVALTSLSLLEEGPYEGVHDVGLVLLQPVTGPGDDVETEMVPDVEAACLGHFLLQEGVPLAPQQQHRRPDVVLAQREGAEGERGERGEKNLSCAFCLLTDFK